MDGRWLVSSHLATPWKVDLHSITDKKRGGGFSSPCLHLTFGSSGNREEKRRGKKKEKRNAGHHRFLPLGLRACAQKREAGGGGGGEGGEGKEGGGRKKGGGDVATNDGSDYSIITINNRKSKGRGRKRRGKRKGKKGKKRGKGEMKRELTSHRLSACPPFLFITSPFEGKKKADKGFGEKGGKGGRV